MKKQHRPGPRTLWDSMWSHTAEIPTGETYNVWEKPDGYHQEMVTYEHTRTLTHWGRLESCAKCRREDFVENFENVLTSTGWAVVLMVGAVTIGVAAIVGYVLTHI